MSTRQKSIRKRCIECAGGRSKVKACEFTDCSLHSFRMGKRPSKSVGQYTAKKAVRLHCTWCVVDCIGVIKACPAKACPLWPYRMGAKVDSEGGTPPIFDGFSRVHHKSNDEGWVRGNNDGNIPCIEGVQRA